MLKVFSLLLLGALAHAEDCDAGAECVGTATDYMLHLQELLGNGAATWRCLCPEARLMARIQNMNYVSFDVAQSLNQYGAYWAFASGVDVLDYYLYLAKTLNDKTAWVKQALVYVGFSESAAADPGKQQLVIFDQDKMDEQWLAGTPNGEHGRKSLQPIWKDEGEDIFDYLGSPFQVCFNPDKENGNTVTDASMCTEKTVKIAEDVIADMLAANYEKLTGCTGGYPYPEGLRLTKADCEANCPGENGVEYCSYSAPMSTANRESTTACIQLYLDQYELVSGNSAALLARAFFEQCLSFNPYFTGLGLGYSTVAGNTTGSEWIVRGDIALNLLDASEPFVLG